MYFNEIQNKLTVLLNELEKNQIQKDLADHLKDCFDRIQSSKEMQCWVLGRSGVGKSKFIESLKVASEKKLRFLNQFDFREKELDSTLLKDVDQRNIPDIIFVLMDCQDVLLPMEKDALDHLNELARFQKIIIVISKVDACPENQWERAQRLAEYHIAKYTRDYNNPIRVLYYSSEEYLKSWDAPSESPLAWVKDGILEFLANMAEDQVVIIHKMLLLQLQEDCKQLRQVIRSIQKSDEQKKLDEDVKENKYAIKEISRRELDIQTELETAQTKLHNEFNSVLQKIESQSQKSSSFFLQSCQPKTFEKDWEKLFEVCKEVANKIYDSIAKLELVLRENPHLQKNLSSFNHRDYKKDLQMMMEVAIPKDTASSGLVGILLAAAFDALVVLTTWQSYSFLPAHLLNKPLITGGIGIIAIALCLAENLYTKKFILKKQRKVMLEFLDTLHTTERNLDQKLKEFFASIVQQVAQYAKDGQNKIQAANTSLTEGNAKFAYLESILQKNEELSQEIVKELKFFGVKEEKQ